MSTTKETRSSAGFRTTRNAPMPGSTAPVIRQPFAPGDLLPFWAYGTPIDDHHLYDADDADEADNQAGSAAADDAIELLRHALETIEAPIHQYERLGIR